ncbi:MAG TPA: hypothetical protein VL463_22055 [Kofleriaceae bacterium]|nr:hypothetical protein [Kofleriaceae bacterium]
MTSTRILTVFALAASASACGSDPVNYSAPVGIELKAKSGDVANAVVTENKAITTESGNPYGAFITDAHTKLGGKDPKEIEIDKLTLTLGGQSTGVTKLEEVLSGDVDVSFIMNDSNNTYDVGHVMNPTGVGPVDMVVSFDGTTVSSTDMPKLLSGSFKVVIRGDAATGFMSKGAEASLQATFTFDAFE